MSPERNTVKRSCIHELSSVQRVWFVLNLLPPPNVPFGRGRTESPGRKCSDGNSVHYLYLCKDYSVKVKPRGVSYVGNIGLMTSVVRSSCHQTPDPLSLLRGDY